MTRPLDRPTHGPVTGPRAPALCKLQEVTVLVKSLFVPRPQGSRRGGVSRGVRAILAVGAGAALACGMLAAAGPAAAAAVRRPAAKPLLHVTIGYENAPDPEMVAIARNDFSRYMHARVTMKYYSSGPAALASLASGSLQFMTVLGNPPLAIALAHGVPLQVIWAQEQYTTGEGLVVRRGRHIDHLAQLAGHRVAVNVGSTSSFELATAEAMQHVPPSRIRIVNMTPPAMVAAWKRGALNAAYVWVPFFSEMVQDGGKALLYDATQGAAAPVFNLAVVNTRFAKAHPAAVLGFVRAEAAGVSYFEHHPAVGYQEIAHVGGLTVSQAKAQAKGLRFITLAGQLTPGGMGKPGHVAASLVSRSLQEAADWLYRSGRISTLPKDLAAAVNPSYAATVLRQMEAAHRSRTARAA